MLALSLGLADVQAVTQPPGVVWMPKTFGHMGQHSGLSGLLPAVKHHFRAPIHVLSKKRAPLAAQSAKALHALTRGRVELPWEAIAARGSPFYREASWHAERAALERAQRTRAAWIFMEGVEDQLGLLGARKASLSGVRLAGISHQPPAWWRQVHRGPGQLEELDLLFVLSEEARAFFAHQLARATVRFVPHGVDSAFFVPAQAEEKAELRVVFGGQWMRDFETLSRVIERSVRELVGVRFDLVVPESAQGTPALARCGRYPEVTFLSGLSDSGLRATYQRASVLLLPLLDATANNTLLEGMATGLPVIVSDVGGVRDYVQSTFADLAAPKDADSLFHLLKTRLSDPAELARRGRLARRHAETLLRWDRAAQTLSGYLDAL